MMMMMAHDDAPETPGLRLTISLVFMEYKMSQKRRESWCHDQGRGKEGRFTWSVISAEEAPDSWRCSLLIRYHTLPQDDHPTQRSWPPDCLCVCVTQAVLRTKRAKEIKTNDIRDEWNELWIAIIVISLRDDSFVPSPSPMWSPSHHLDEKWL